MAAPPHTHRMTMTSNEAVAIVARVHTLVRSHARRINSAGRELVRNEIAIDQSLDNNVSFFGFPVAG